MPRALLAALLLTACAGRRPPPAPLLRVADAGYQGPDHTVVDLLRPWEDGPRIYVQAVLPDGELGLFQVDTGAAISVLSEATATRLGLSIDEDSGSVVGLGGRASFDRAVLSLQLGDAVVRGVDVAVGIPGLGDRVAAMPLDGILGNNVWARFVVEVDYPRDELRLHRPGTFQMPRRSAPMVFDGGHAVSPLVITTGGPKPVTVPLVATLDTGAGDLLLQGLSEELSQGAEGTYTVGLEPILGLGASEIVPPSRFFVTTRRIPLAIARLGGRDVKLRDVQARWLGYDVPTPSILGDGWSLDGLVGHELMVGHVATFDYQGGRFALARSRGRGRSMDGHAVLLEQDLARFGDDVSRYWFRAQLHTMLEGTDGEPHEHLDEAARLIESYLAWEHATDVPDARVYLAQLYRAVGDLPRAWQAVEPLSPLELVAAGSIVAVVNGLVLAERPEDALAVANAAVEEAEAAHLSVTDRSLAWVARADVLFAQGDSRGAHADLLQAARIVENPDAHLLRRSRIALATEDRFGAMAHMRRLLQLYPSVGSYVWFYALLLEDGDDTETFRADVDHAMDRLHPAGRPLDFLVAVHRTLGEVDQARDLMREGIDRDCHIPQTTASQDNCIAWYKALAAIDLDDAIERIDRALAADGARSDFLDTKAMVHLSRGEIDQAYEAAVSAARLSPDDVYMLWQVERLRGMAHPVTEVAELGATDSTAWSVPEAP